jgi:hypothetical protein
VREALLTDGDRLVSLTGQGGVGKTSLAVRCGEALLEDFRVGRSDPREKQFFAEIASAALRRRQRRVLQKLVARTLPGPRPRQKKGPRFAGLSIAGVGFEPATFGL